MAAYKTVEVVDHFSAAVAAFEKLKAVLASSEALAMEHARLEALVEERGREVLRELLQAHLDLRASKEVRAPVQGADGEVRTLLRDSSRLLDTIFGPVRVSRVQATSRSAPSLHPLDAELNLPQEMQSFGVQRRIAEEVAKSSFEEVVEVIGTQTGASVSKRQAEKLARRAAADFDDFYRVRPPTASSDASLLVLSFDGKGIVVRKDDLREATRRAAETSEHKLATRLSKGEKRNRKRMAEVATVYDIAPHVRTVEDVIGDLRPLRPATPPRPRPNNKRVWASVTKEMATVIAEGFDEAERRDPARRRRWVALVDGNKRQIKLIRAEAEHRGIELTLVLDFIHVAEYLWKAAYCFHAEGTKGAEAWVTHRLSEVLRGKSSDVAAGIRRAATLRGLSKTVRKPADACARYLLTNRAFLRYDAALAAGLPIATGVIEGACRHLVKDRMDITGARWSLDGADAVLRLRALRSCGDFDAYWNFHLACERERNHLSRYADRNPRNIKPKLAPSAQRGHLRVVSE